MSLKDVAWDVDNDIPLYTEDYLKMKEQKARLVWAACPVCYETWSERVPFAEDWTEEIIAQVMESLSFEARRHKSKQHDNLEIQAGVEYVSD